MAQGYYKSLGTMARFAGTISNAIGPENNDSMLRGRDDRPAPNPLRQVINAIWNVRTSGARVKYYRKFFFIPIRSYESAIQRHFGDGSYYKETDANGGYVETPYGGFEIIINSIFGAPPEKALQEMLTRWKKVNTDQDWWSWPGSFYGSKKTTDMIYNYAQNNSIRVAGLNDQLFYEDRVLLFKDPTRAKAFLQAVYMLPNSDFEANYQFFYRIDKVSPGKIPPYATPTLVTVPDYMFNKTSYDESKAHMMWDALHEEIKRRGTWDSETENWVLNQQSPENTINAENAKHITSNLLSAWWNQVDLKKMKNVRQKRPAQYGLADENGNYYLDQAEDSVLLAYKIALLHGSNVAVDLPVFLDETGRVVAQVEKSARQLGARPTASPAEIMVEAYRQIIECRNLAGTDPRLRGFMAEDIGAPSDLRFVKNWDDLPDSNPRKHCVQNQAIVAMVKASANVPEQELINLLRNEVQGKKIYEMAQRLANGQYPSELLRRDDRYWNTNWLREDGEKTPTAKSEWGLWWKKITRQFSKDDIPKNWIEDGINIGPILNRSASSTNTAPSGTPIAPVTTGVPRAAARLTAGVISLETPEGAVAKPLLSPHDHSRERSVDRMTPPI